MKVKKLPLQYESFWFVICETQTNKISNKIIINTVQTSSVDMIYFQVVHVKEMLLLNTKLICELFDMHNDSKKIIFFKFENPK